MSNSHTIIKAALRALEESAPLEPTAERRNVHRKVTRLMQVLINTMAHPVATLKNGVLELNHKAPNDFKAAMQKGTHKLFAAAPCTAQPSIDEALQILHRWQDAIQALAQEFEPVFTAFGRVVEGPVPDALTGIECALTDATADLLGCSREELQWHWLENDFGAKGRVCFLNGEEITVRTLEDFAKTLGYYFDEAAA